MSLFPPLCLGECKVKHFRPFHNATMQKKRFAPGKSIANATSLPCAERFCIVYYDGVFFRGTPSLHVHCLTL